MKIVDLIARASRSLRSAKLRTLLTSLAIAVGGFTLTLTLAGSNGARQYADRLVSSNFDPTELIVGSDPEIANDGPPDGRPKEYDDTVASFNGGGGQSGIQLKRLDQDDITAISKLDFVEQVRENYQIAVQYISREGQKRYTAAAEGYNPAQKPELAYGALPSSGDIEKGTTLLPDAYIESLGFAGVEDALSREVTLTVRKPFTQELAREILSTATTPEAAAAAAQNSTSDDTKTITLKIAGVTKKSATSFNFGTAPLLLSGEDTKELYDFTTKGTPDFEKYLYAYVKVKDGDKSSAIEEAQSKLEEAGYYTQSVQDIQKSLLQIVSTLQIVVMVFGLITLVASVFGIVNTQYISVLERTREIGLMKALGMRARDISRLFIIEAVWIGFLGGALGSLFAVVLGLIINPWLSDVIGFDKGTYILVFRPIQILLLVLGLMLIAMVAGLLPARKAAKLDPIEALRTE